MFAIHQNVVPDLDSWGTVADLGSEIVEGEGLCFGKMIHGSPDMPLSCGYFATVKGKFRMTYPFSEHAIVVEGSVTLTDESTVKPRPMVPEMDGSSNAARRSCGKSIAIVLPKIMSRSLELKGVISGAG